MPSEEQFRRHVVSNAKMWSSIARKLGRAGDFTEWLTPVAYFVCIDYCLMLAAGRSDGLAGPDRIAAADCPMTVEELRDLRERLRHMRDTILHIGTMTAPGTVMGTDHEATGDIAFRATRFERKVRHAPEIRRSEIEATLDVIEPWLQRHFERLVLRAP